MGDFSRFERTIATSLSNTPKLKRILKRLHSHLTYLLAAKGNAANATSPVKTPAIDGETFFGYYDKVPDNGKGIVLCHRSAVSTKKHPSAVRSIDVIGLTTDLQQPLFVIPTAAFNWQQGARLQWCNAGKFIFNDYDQKRARFVSHLYDAGTGRKLRTYDLPVQDCFQDKFFLTVDYAQLARFSPDYGYFGKATSDVATGAAKLPNVADGIWKVDFTTGDCHLLLSKEAVLDCEAETNYGSADHTLNHIMISPCGSKFIFFHRYYVGGVRKDRLLLANVDSGRVQVLLEEKIISHFTWLDSNTLLGFYSIKGAAPEYRLMHLSEGSHVRFEPFQGLSDGHPSSSQGRVITDTYADRSSRQKLFISDLDLNSRNLLGCFLHSSSFFGETRCDLHPRFSFDGDRIYFDSVFNGARQFCAIDL